MSLYHGRKNEICLHVPDMLRFSIFAIPCPLAEIPNLKTPSREELVEIFRFLRMFQFTQGHQFGADL